MSARRIRCLGDCGRWWYYQSAAAYKGGRPCEWCPECYRARRNDRARKAAPLRCCDVCGIPIGKYRGFGVRGWCDRCVGQEQLPVSGITGRSEKRVDDLAGVTA